MSEDNWWDQSGSPAFYSAVGETGNLFAGRIPDEESLTQMIMKHLEEVDLKIPRRVKRKDGFHPSALGDMCLREAVFQRVLPKAQDARRFPGTVKLRFAIGTAVHDHWQTQIMGKMRVLRGTWQCSRCTHKVKNTFMPHEPCTHCQWQVKPNPKDLSQRIKAERSRYSEGCAANCAWPSGDRKPFFSVGRDCAFCERGGKWLFRESSIYLKEFDIVGFYDGIVLYNGEERVIDLKTKDVYAWENLSEPDAKAIMQIRIYMWALNVPRGVIAYINKNSGLMKEFLVEQDPEMIEQVKRNIEFVHRAIEENELPNGVCGSKRDSRAKQCAYADECFMGCDNITALKELLTARARDEHEQTG